MFIHNKRLQYTVRVGETNPALGSLLLEQFGGPDGELAAAMRYFTQALAEDDPGRKDMLLDIATEELSHLEVIGSIVAMLNKGAKAQLSEAAMKEAELYRSLTAGGDSHTQSILYGGGPALTNSSGVPWTSAYIDSRRRPELRPALQHRRRKPRQDHLRAADQHHRRSRDQGRAGLPHDAGDLPPEVVREGAVRHHRQLPARQAPGRRRPSPTCTSTPRRARAICRGRGTPVSSGSASTISSRSCPPARAMPWRRETQQGRADGGKEPRRTDNVEIPPPTRPREPISAPGRAPDVRPMRIWARRLISNTPTRPR